MLVIKFRAAEVGKLTNCPAIEAPRRHAFFPLYFTYLLLSNVIVGKSQRSKCWAAAPYYYCEGSLSRV